MTQRPRYFLTRLYVALSVMVNVAITATEPQALSFKVVDHTGPVGWFLMACLFGLACLACLDVLVNDLLPERFVLPTAVRWRHLVYMAIPMGQVSLVYAIVDAHGFTTLILTYLLDAVVCVTAAVLDLFHRQGKDAQ